MSSATRADEKARNLDLNDYSRRAFGINPRCPAFYPADLSRALSGAQTAVRAKLTLRNSDLQTPARLADLEGGGNMVVGSGPEELGKPVNPNFRCST